MLFLYLVLLIIFPLNFEYPLFKISFNSLFAGFLAYLSLQILAPLVDMHTFLGIFIQGFIAGIIGLISYVILSIVFKLKEVEGIKKILIKTLALIKNGRN